MEYGVTGDDSIYNAIVLASPYGLKSLFCLSDPRCLYKPGRLDSISFKTNKTNTTVHALFLP